MPRPVYVRAVHHGCCLSPAPASAAGNGREHFKIPQQGGSGGFCFRLLFVDGPAGFQKQRRFFEDPVPHLRRRITPGRVQLAGFTTAELVRGNGIRHPLAVFDVGASHRNQILHGDMGCNLSQTNLLLDGIRKQFYQCQAA
jgi:hypothetical protein